MGQFSVKISGLPGSHLSGNQHLRLIYRLLFLMVAEERRLLFVASREEAARQEIYTRWYSIARLRERADIRFFDDGESDLWEGLKQTCRLFEDSETASQLGLTALDGELFGRVACTDLIDAENQPGPRLKNVDLLSAVWRLSTFEDADGKKKRGPRRRVNFAGVDVEELGSVYEALLDYHPRVTIEGERSRFELVEGSERKKTGSYYTPPELVRELIKSALEPVIADRLAMAPTKDDKEGALLALKVCDPASGSGHFMLAAARCLGRELARVRSGEAEPNPAEHRNAVRDVIRRCVYAVDKNPLAVDLCKVALWIEGHEPGLPLSFLDHHVKCGDSLVGVLDLKALEAGIPDDAYTAVTGDDKKLASAIKKVNKAEAKKISLFSHNVNEDIDRIAGTFAAVADLPETTPDEVHAKELCYADLRRSCDWERAKAACDLWTTSFFAPLTEDGKAAVPTTRHIWESISGRLSQGRVADLARRLADEQHFFHWPLEFPEVFAQGGFDVMLGNPPWEVSQLGEEEYFAQSLPRIAALKGAARKCAIASLAQSEPAVFAQYQIEKRQIEAVNKFARVSGRFDLTARGKINTYALFAELAASVVDRQGRVGLVLKTEIATGKDTAPFFESLVTECRLISLIDFENREGLFDIHRSYRFCLFTLGEAVEDPVFGFNLTNPAQLKNPERTFVLRPEDMRCRGAAAALPY